MEVFVDLFYQKFDEHFVQVCDHESDSHREKNHLVDDVADDDDDDDMTFDVSVMNVYLIDEKSEIYQVIFLECHVSQVCDRDSWTHFVQVLNHTGHCVDQVVVI